MKIRKKLKNKSFNNLRLNQGPLDDREATGYTHTMELIQ